jgi:chromosome partitioning protein
MTNSTIAVTNQKGGVGKTTTTVNLGAALAAMGNKTLIVDMDPQGHAGEHLGLSDHDKGVLKVLQGKNTAEEVIIKSYKKNLDCLCSSLQLGQFNQMSAAGNQFMLAKALEKARQEYRYILIDCQPSLSLLTLNALTASDYVILPVQAEFFALDGLSQLILTLKEIQGSMHPNLKVLGILLTMFDRRNRLSIEVKNELYKNFENELFKAMIPRNIKIAEAPSFGKSVLDYDSMSPGSDAYKHLGREIVKKC